MSKKWYVLQFKTNSHYIAQQNLKRQKFETFIPMQEIVSQKGSKFFKQLRPLFPGYMFIKFDSSTTSWQKINNTYGVIRLVNFNSGPVSVSTELITQLIQQCDTKQCLTFIKSFKKGDHVRITNGPFLNFLSTIESIEQNQRIWLLLDLMGTKIKTKINLKNIELSI